jgi:hypothetical protein
VNKRSTYLSLTIFTSVGHVFGTYASVVRNVTRGIRCQCFNINTFRKEPLYNAVSCYLNRPYYSEVLVNIFILLLLHFL